MKALSLRQPWAHAVLYYGKTLENRRWSTTFRGEFLIHAAKGMTRDEYDDAEDSVAYHSGWTVDGSSGISDRALFAADFKTRGHRGGFVGTAHLVTVIPPCWGNAGGLFDNLPRCAHPWHMPEQYAFVLEDVRPIPFVPYKGALGFFDVPDEVVARMALPLRPRGEAAHGLAHRNHMDGSHVQHAHWMRSRLPRVRPLLRRDGLPPSRRPTRPQALGGRPLLHQRCLLEAAAQVGPRGGA